MAEASGEVPLIVEERKLVIRKLNYKVKQKELTIESNEIRLLDINREKDRVEKGIEIIRNEIEELKLEIQSIKEGE